VPVPDGDDVESLPPQPTRAEETVSVSSETSSEVGRFVIVPPERQ
jgi:hypothetical protein